MLRIRTGSSWPHDPALRAALRLGADPRRTEVAREVVDALALEVDGVDLAAGLAEGPLLPTLESLLRATARVLGGASHATVAFADGQVELLLRRRGRSALLSVVSLSRPSRVLARDVEVDLDALAAAALDACATLCGERPPPGRGGDAPAAARPPAAAGPPRPAGARGGRLLHGGARRGGRSRRRVRGRPRRPGVAARAGPDRAPPRGRARARRPRRAALPRRA